MWSRQAVGAAGEVEADFGRFAFRGGSHFKEFARLEAEHAGKNTRRELLNLGVQVAHDGVVIAARVLHAVFDLRQRILQRGETFDGAKLRISFG